MGRELQKRKNRSSIPKVRRKPKSKKRLLQHPVIAANWDKGQTLAQNYKRLGLTARLNKNTGGVEKKVGDVVEEREDVAAERIDGLRIDGRQKKAEKLIVTDATIERDPETGRIVRVLEQDNGRANPLNDTLNELDSNSESEGAEMFDQHGHPKTTNGFAGRAAEGTVVKYLEEESSRPAPVYRRNQSEGEKAFVEALVRKYGDDYGKMARDMHINYMQRSAGDLKKRIKRWKGNGGSIA